MKILEIFLYSCGFCGLHEKVKSGEDTLKAPKWELEKDSKKERIETQKIKF
jgi:hypothetical protein